MSTELEVMIDEARDPNTTWNRLKSLYRCSDKDVRRAMLNNPNLCPINEEGKLNSYLLRKLAEEFPEEVADHPLFVLHALVEPNEDMKDVVIHVMKRTENAGLMERVISLWGSSHVVLEAVARNTHTPIDILTFLINDTARSRRAMRLAVAQNPSTPENLLRMLANQTTTSPEEEVLEAIAKNPNTPVDILRKFGNEKTELDWRLRFRVGLNPSTPIDVLCILGTRESESSGFVRQAVALNTKTPQEILRILGNEATESSLAVRKAVAENPSTPIDVLVTLSKKEKESEKEVRRAANKSMKTRSFLVQMSNFQAKNGLRGNGVGSPARGSS